jgi:hypothetical protein
MSLVSTNTIFLFDQNWNHFVSGVPLKRKKTPTKNTYVYIFLAHWAKCWSRYAFTKSLSTKDRKRKSGRLMSSVKSCEIELFCRCLLALWTNFSMNCLFAHWPLLLFGFLTFKLLMTQNEYFQLVDFEWLYWISFEF